MSFCSQISAAQRKRPKWEFNYFEDKLRDFWNGIIETEAELLAAREEGLSYKQIANQLRVGEASVSRIFVGPLCHI